MTPCEGCHSGCCRAFVVPLTGADMLTIARDRELTFWDFVVRYADESGEIAHNYAPHFHFDDDPDTPYVLGLKRAPSATFPRLERCQFLEEQAPTAAHPLGTAHCGIYESRPSACRIFPTKFDHSGDLVQLELIPRSVESRGEMHALCPRPWTPADVDPITQIQNLVIAQYEMRFLHTLAAAWNQTPGPWTLFPVFVEFIYSNRVVDADAEAESADQLAPVLQMLRSAA